ncbi:unnamed protein product [Laminaria digitata]
MVIYAEAKENFIATKLRPADDKRKAIAVQALRSGAPFGAAVYRPKAVQIWASHGNPGLRASREDKQVDGFDVSFNVGPPEDRPQAKARVPPGSSHGGAVGGACVGPDDGMHDDDDNCRSDHGGDDVKRRRKFKDYMKHGIRNVDASGRQPKNHAKLKNKKCEYVLSALDFDRFAFVGTLLNELEHEDEIGRRSLYAMVKDYGEHSREALTFCQLRIYSLGRCWCDTPMVRWYDQSGRSRLAFLE